MRALASRLFPIAALLVLGAAAQPASAGGVSPAKPGHHPGGVRAARSVGHGGGFAVVRPGYGRVVDSRIVRVDAGRHGPRRLGAYGYGAAALGAYPFIRHRSFYLDEPRVVRETAFAPERPAAPPPIPSLADIPASTGIREAGPSRPALHVIGPGRREAMLRPNARVVQVGEAARRDDGWDVPFTGPRIIELRGR